MKKHTSLFVIILLHFCSFAQDSNDSIIYIPDSLSHVPKTELYTYKFGTICKVHLFSNDVSKDHNLVYRSKDSTLFTGKILRSYSSFNQEETTTWKFEKGKLISARKELWSKRKDASDEEDKYLEKSTFNGGDYSIFYPSGMTKETYKQHMEPIDGSVESHNNRTNFYFENGILNRSTNAIFKSNNDGDPFPQFFIDSNYNDSGALQYIDYSKSFYKSSEESDLRQTVYDVKGDTLYNVHLINGKLQGKTIFSIPILFDYIPPGFENVALNRSAAGEISINVPVISYWKNGFLVDLENFNFIFLNEADRPITKANFITILNYNLDRQDPDDQYAYLLTRIINPLHRINNFQTESPYALCFTTNRLRVTKKSSRKMIKRQIKFENNEIKKGNFIY